MQFPDRKIIYDSILILMALFIAFGIAYYKSANSGVKTHHIYGARYQSSSLLQRNQHQIPLDHILLKKDEKHFTEKTCLIFKGLSNGNVNVELFLLEFDPNISYLKQFAKKSALDGIWLGNVMYQFVKVKKDVLHLKILKIRKSG